MRERAEAAHSGTPRSAGWEAPRRSVAAGPAASLPSVDDRDNSAAPLDLLRQADALGIPWRRILSDEILAESVLQRFLSDQLTELPLWRALSILPSSHLNSWRVRDAVHRLSWQASQGSREARAELARLHAALAGSGRSATVSLGAHQWFAYQRVLELRAIAAFAHRAPRDAADAAEFLTRALACSRRDAEWALSGRSARTDFYALEDAMRRVREEGFDIPCGETELESFLRLRACVRRNGYLPKRRPRAEKSRRARR